jgi:HEAT repeat protein
MSTLIKTFKFGLIVSCSLFLLATGAKAQTAPTEGIDARADTNELGRQLGNPDPLVRQRAAEAIAQLAATDQRKVIEGYYLQEKNKDVRLALEWASYRIGKQDALYRIVSDLDSSRHDQAVGYLAQLDSPDLLYPYLDREKNKPKILAGILDALGKSGNSETRQKIEPFRDSLQEGVAAAAERAIDQIDARASQADATKPGRPRIVSKPD